MLTLTIEKKWFDMSLSGEKTEEYRELKRYYDSRFRNAAMLKNQEYQASVSEFRNLAATVDQDIGTVKFRNGYAPDAPCFLADCKLTVGEGKPECEKYFHDKYPVREDRSVEVGKTYRHFKGKIVEVIAISQDTESPGQYYVVYKCEDGAIWSRPYGMFVGKVDRKKYPDADQEYRFEEV